MKIETPKNFWRWLNASPTTPAGLAARAAVLLLGFAIIHALGWREHTTFLSGTTTTAAISRETAAVLGVIYICAYLGAVVVAPILLLASALLAALRRL
ncbi:MAG: hypothetical protein NTY53_24840 [Kiritimatiellaeota bacterium]|nr:hypothetical protein [Kiritimatiellota bacterium]